MATNRYLLGADKFKELTPVHSNVDSDLIKQSILSCQDMFIEPTLGSGLMDYIKTNLSSLGASYVTLLEDYIHPCMLHWVMADLTGTITRRFTNIGLQTKSGENSFAASDEAIRRERNRAMNKAIHYAQRLWDYLCENDATFTLFDNPGTGYDVIFPQSRVRNTGIYLGGLRGKRKTGLDSFSDDEHFRSER